MLVPGLAFPELLVACFRGHTSPTSIHTILFPSEANKNFPSHPLQYNTYMIVISKIGMFFSTLQAVIQLNFCISFSCLVHMSSEMKKLTSKSYFYHHNFKTQNHGINEWGVLFTFLFQLQLLIHRAIFQLHKLPSTNILPLWFICAPNLKSVIEDLGE